MFKFTSNKLEEFVLKEVGCATEMDYIEQNIGVKI